MFTFEERPPDAPFAELIWRTQSDNTGGSFISLAASQWEMVVTRQQGQTTLTVRGPERRARPAPIPENAEFFGITFNLGTFMPHLPVGDLVDREINLPEARDKTFWLHSAAWEVPTYENADIFINRLVREGLLVHDPVVEAALRGQPQELSARSVQRHFRRATGLTHSTIHQIERARQAAALLESGMSILDTVYQAGYADQPHLTRSLKRFVGQTPAQITR